MKRKFGNLLMAATLVFAMGVSFTSCKDYDEELVAEMNAQAQSLEELNEELAADKAALETVINGTVLSLDAEITALEERIKELEAIDHDHSSFATKEELEAAKAELDEAIAALAVAKADKAALEEVASSLEDLKGEFASHVQLFNALSDKVNDAVARLTTLEGQYKELDAAVAQAQKDIKAVQTELTKVAAQAAAADALAKANSEKIAVLEENDKALAQALVDSVAAVRAEAAANLVEAKAYTDAVAAALEEELAATNATVAELQAALDNAVAELQDQIDVLQEEVDEMYEELAVVNERVDGLVDEIAGIKETLNKQITGVSVHGAYSPVIGYFSWPTGVKSNILAAYYGSADADVEFPTALTANNVGAAIDEAVFNAMGFTSETYSAGTLIGGNGNAGKLYLTINPAEVEVTADQLALVNSLGEKSPATITDLKVSTEKLAFGYTRAGAVSLYEAEATIAAEDVENAKLRIELSALKDAIKDVVTVKDGISVTNIATTLYTLFNDIADAHAVQATWTDAEGVAHTVYSDYGLATVAVKPLGYSFLADLNVESIPGYHRGMNLVNRVFDKVGALSIPDLGLDRISAKLESINLDQYKLGASIKEEISFKVNLSTSINYTLETEVEVPLGKTSVEVEVPSKDITLSGAGGTVTGKTPAQIVTVEIDGSKIVNGKIQIKKNLVIPVNVEVPVTIKTSEVLGDLGQSLDNVDAVIDQLQSYLDKVNALIASVDGKIEVVESVIDAALDKVQSGLNTYLGALNNKVCGLVNSFNAVLQPTMLVTTADGFSMLSSIKGAPTTIDGTSAVLVPTSFTAEILAPAYKKFVAVTNAYDDNGNEDIDAAKAANTGHLATVLNGETRTVEFNGKSGYTYEITYSAVDFYGMISNTKYYVRVK